VFQKEEIEPLQVKQQDVNWLGQGLIQSAANSTSTQGLEQDLDEVNARWKTLNKKVILSSPLSPLRLLVIHWCLL
jgi:dystonin